MGWHLLHLPRWVGWLVTQLVKLSDFLCIGLAGPFQSVRGPRDVIYFLKAMTNSFQTLIYFCKVYPAIWENKKTRKNYKKKKNKQSNPQLEPTNCCFSKKSFTFQKSIPAFVWSAPKCVMINTSHYDNKYLFKLIQSNVESMSHKFCISHKRLQKSYLD